MALCRRIEIYPLDSGYLIEILQADKQGNWEPTLYTSEQTPTAVANRVKQILLTLKNQQNVEKVRGYPQPSSDS